MENDFDRKYTKWDSKSKSIVFTAPAGFPGQGSLWFTSTAPDGWLICDGSVVNIADYPRLFQVIGAAYGGNGTTTFGLPDLRQRFPMGKAASGTGSTLGGTGGAVDHTHKGYGDGGDLRAAIGAVNNNSTYLGYIGLSGINPNTGSGSPNPTYVLNNMGNTGYTGPWNHHVPVYGYTSTNNPPFLSVNFIIKY